MANTLARIAKTPVPPRRLAQAAGVAAFGLVIVVVVRWVPSVMSDWKESKARAFLGHQMARLEANLEVRFKLARGPKNSQPPNSYYAGAAESVDAQFPSSTPLQFGGDWAANVRATSTNALDLARVEFLSWRFVDALFYYDQDAADRLSRRDRPGADRRRLTTEAADALTRSGEVRRLMGDLPRALGRFGEAAALINRGDDPVRWAALQLWSGIVHQELGIEVNGDAADGHLRSAVTAYRAALEVFTAASAPDERAMTQINLGSVLLEQARRTAGTEAVRLLRESIEASRAAVGSDIRKPFPEGWASAQVILGRALHGLADQSRQTEAGPLLAESLTAYRAAMSVWGRAPGSQYTMERAETQTRIGQALQDLAKLTGGELSAPILGEAVTAFRAALAEAGPFAAAPAEHINIGDLLREQASLGNGIHAIRLLNEASAAYCWALERHHDILANLSPERATIRGKLIEVILEIAKRGDALRTVSQAP